MMSSTGIGPPRWTKVHRISRASDCWRAARRAARGSTGLRAFNSSAVRISRFAKVRYVLGGEAGGSDWSDRHRGVVEAHGHQHRDDTLCPAVELALDPSLEPAPPGAVQSRTGPIRLHIKRPARGPG